MTMLSKIAVCAPRSLRFCSLCRCPRAGSRATPDARSCTRAVRTRASAHLSCLWEATLTCLLTHGQAPDSSLLYPPPSPTLCYLAASRSADRIYPRESRVFNFDASALIRTGNGIVENQRGYRFSIERCEIITHDLPKTFAWDFFFGGVEKFSYTLLI